MRKVKKVHALLVNTLSRQALEVFFQCSLYFFLSPMLIELVLTERRSLELSLFSVSTLFFTDPSSVTLRLGEKKINAR